MLMKLRNKSTPISGMSDAIQEEQEIANSLGLIPSSGQPMSDAMQEEQGLTTPLLNPSLSPAETLCIDVSLQSNEKSDQSSSQPSQSDLNQPSEQSIPMVPVDPDPIFEAASSSQDASSGGEANNSSSSSSKTTILLSK